MKFKKFVSIMLLFILILACFGAVPALAAKNKSGEFFINGDMELLGTGYGKWIGVGQQEKEIVRNGEKAIKLESADTSKKLTILQNSISGIIPEKEYTLSAYVYIKELMPEGKTGLKLEYYDENDNFIMAEGPVFFNSLPKENWTEISITVIAPADAAKADIHLRLDFGGCVIFDDVKFSGEMTEETFALQETLKKAYYEASELGQKLYEEQMAEFDRAVIIDGFENPVANPGFEEAEGTKATGWGCQGEEWGTLISVTDEEAHSGTKSLKITSESSGATTWARTYISLEDGAFIPGEDHLLSAWVKYKSVEENKGAFMKMEPDVSVAGAGEMSSGNYLFDDNEWHKINFVFNVNTNTTKLGLLIRLRGAGEIYYDDVTFGPIESMTELMVLDSDTFFYTENETGTATAQIDNSKTPIPEGAYVEFAIKDGEKILASETVFAKRNTKWEFDVMTMAEMKRPYTLEATYKAADGTPLSETKTNEIYRYNRPGAFAADGTYMKDGKPFYPYIAYETIEDYMPLASEIGVNVMRSYSRPIGYTNSMENIKAMLDEALKNGLMVSVALYSEPAGHPTMLERTRKIVTEFKDHPAVFAWMIMDEPSLHVGSNRTVKTYEEMVHWLKQSYIEIRAIDDYHPVYVLETLGQVKNPYLYSSRNADVFVIDPYPMTEARIPTWVGERTDVAINTVNNEKPVYVIQESYKGYEKTKDLYSANDARHQFYQAVLSGASGIGLYGFTFETDLDNPTGKMDMYSDKEVWEDYKQIKESGELAEIQDHFFGKNHPTFNECYVDGYQYYSWLKNGDIYTVVMNMNVDDKTVDIDLTSTNGRVKTDGFTASVINGSDMVPVSCGGNTLSVNLGKRQVILFKITPNNEIDETALSDNKYDDLGGFDWAEEAIEMLGKEGIANDTGEHLFSPERNITRGEFAYFLMNTLGITDTEGTAQFDDVDENAFYANAILAGRKAGILLGSGGGVYNPEEGISRQDAMTICARALKQNSMIGVADSSRILAGFTDSGIIADYAAEHIASMVDEEIVKGNPDGTVNPLGNITRAEAAVIMQRILNLN